MARSIFKVAEYYAQILKTADYPSIETISPVVKQTIDNLKSVHPDVMRGVLYASNVQATNSLDEFKVSFLLNVDEDPRWRDAIAVNKNNRDNLIQSSLTKILKINYQAFNFKIHFSEFPTAKPGWFDKKVD